MSYNYMTTHLRCFPVACYQTYVLLYNYTSISTNVMILPSQNIAPPPHRQIVFGPTINHKTNVNTVVLSLRYTYRYLAGNQHDFRQTIYKDKLRHISLTDELAG